MRIHRLTMTAVGPYAGTEVVDFDRFTSSGRFLLTGPTGSGKTTIIDAIVFALYGQVADGDDSSKDRIRSTHAEPATRTEVELVFSTSAGTYRLQRSPEYQRPKKRGGGTTKESATARLWHLTSPEAEPTEEPVTSPREVGAEVVRLLGLSREQFTQTVVLPQGKFARFLRATSAERHELLRDVFGTGIYDRIQEEIAERSRAAKRHSQEARASLDTATRALEPLLNAEEHELGDNDGGVAALEVAQAEGPLGMTDASPAPTDRPAREAGRSLEAVAAEAAQGELDLPTTGESAAGEASASADQSNSTGEYAPLLAWQRLQEATAEQVPDPKQVNAVLDQALASRASQLKLLEDRIDQAGEGRAQAAGALEAAKTLTTNLARRSRLLEEQSHLEAQAPAIQAAAQRLERAEAAARTTAPAQVLKRAETAQTQAVTRARCLLTDEQQPQVQEAGTAALAALTVLSTSNDGQDASAQADLERTSHHLTDTARQARHQAGELDALTRTEAGLPERAKGLASRLSALAEAETQLSEAKAVLGARPAQLEDLQARAAAARHAQDSLPALVVARDQAQARHDAATQVNKLAVQIEVANQTLVSAKAEAEKAEDQVHAQRRAWIAATAGTLVSELEAGQPCPLCGSTSHPHPAQPKAGAVTRKQVEAAEAAAASLRKVLQQAAAHQQMLTAKHAHAIEQSGGQSLETSTAALTTAQEALATAQEQAAPLTEVEAQVQAFSQQTATLAELAAAAEARNQAAAKAIKAEQATLDADTAQVTQARDGAKTVAERVAALTAQAGAAEAGAQALQDCLNAVTAVTQARADLQAALAAEGLENLAQAEALRLPGPELAALRTQVDTARAEKHRITAAFTEPEIAALTGQEKVNLPAATTAYEQADATLTEAVRLLERARAEYQNLTKACTAVSDATQALAQVSASQAALLRVATLVAGDNDATTPLATWVLLERFQEVLVFANQRLADMSSGRYELIRVDDESGSARRKDRGLGLGVIDHLVGQAPRDPKTLSGGETFYVSLSLALALADVVSTESGGITMETLFIDEGFGTLDPETLEKVIAELSHLQAGGRTVGIVSHMEELRRQIPDRIEVKRAPTGSTLSVTAS
ncbi:AAA family ATPase [Actinomyces trachealis]|uniref:AAA family ATPase n=1 Tax=Actinomyces trachealis TaxID=2763540 RepID=UPI0018929BF6|nr:SMC family ATPase [Actinomyces trachealis]